jgi:hypothetical protein
MTAEAWRWLLPWPVLALAYAVVAVALARRGASGASVALWVTTTLVLAALYTFAFTRWLPADVMPPARLFGASLFVFGTPTGAARAASLALVARRPERPRLALHLAATAVAALLGGVSGGVAALRLLELPHALP